MGWEGGGGEILVWGDEGSPGGIATSWLAWKARGVVPEVDVSGKIVAKMVENLPGILLA